MKKFLVVLSAIMITSLCLQPAGAATDIGFYGIGAKLGYVMPEDPIESTFGFGIQARLGTIMENLALDPFFEFWSKGYDENFGGVTADWSYTEFVLGASAKYFFPTQNQIKPYAGGGLGFVIGRSSWEWTNPVNDQKEDDSDSNTDIGIHFLGGVEMEINDQFDGTFEVKYAIDGANYFGFFFGAIYKLK
ncbi:MAG: outer membrane beta-barrel protein [bacterium]|nr:porin family protein [bacterium]